jgi:hypothetical protein
MGFVRINWRILAAGLLFQTMWQYFVGRIPPSGNCFLGGPGTENELSDGWNSLFVLVGAWVEVPALLIAGPLISEWKWVADGVIFLLACATWMLLLLLARSVFRLTHRAISSV